jgi:hypothetical protein
MCHPGKKQKYAQNMRRYAEICAAHMYTPWLKLIFLYISYNGKYLTKEIASMTLEEKQMGSREFERLVTGARGTTGHLEIIENRRSREMAKPI